MVHSSRAQKVFFFTFCIVGVSMGLVGYGLTERDAVITCQFARLRTPRTRATESGWNPHLHRSAHAGPLRACEPRSREREKSAPAGIYIFLYSSKIRQFCTYTFVLHRTLMLASNGCPCRITSPHPYTLLLLALSLVVLLMSL